MQYFIGYTLPKVAREAHEAETKRLAELFSILPLHDRSVPHLTFKAPFEFENINTLTDHLKEFCQTQKAGNIKIDGYIQLHDRTIGWKAVSDKKSILFVRNLIAFINSIPGLPQDDRTNREESLHASVARFLTPEKLAAIWEYLQTVEKPQYQMKLGAISIYHKVADKW